MFIFTFMLIAFIIGYTIIALEHPLKINKTATALLLGVILWTCAVIGGEGILVNSEPLHDYLTQNPGSTFTDWLVHSELLHALGEIAEILFFLMGAMSIVEIVDTHGGFKIITDKIKTTKKTKLLWIASILTFFMSAVLDNLTTSIVMIALLRKLIGDRHERWFFASMVILAANAGGAWSPIGDVTTIMLWIAGNVSAGSIIAMTLLPSLVCLIVPLVILTFLMKGEITRPQEERHHVDAAFITTKRHRIGFLVVGVGGLICVPIFKTITHLPPYIGMLGALGILWVMSEIVHRHDDDIVKSKYSILSIISNIDIPSILFFLGILLAVNALKTVGHLSMLSNGLDSLPIDEPGKYYVINVIIGVFSSIVDNVPLVAGAMGMYNFPTDHYFWSMLAYCAGTGGSILIIGSAAGVAVMGLEKIDFIWYFKKISLLALSGYIAGALVFIGQKTILDHFSGKEENKGVVEMTEDGVREYITNNTFYTTQEASFQGSKLHDSTTYNVIGYTDGNDQLIGMSQSRIVTDRTKEQCVGIMRGSEMYQGKMNVKIEDTMAFVDINGGCQLSLSRSGRLFFYEPSPYGGGNVIELKKK